MSEENLRIELIHDGSLQHEGYQPLGYYIKPALHGPMPRVLDERGDYRWSVFAKGGELIGSQGYSPLFGEWQSTLKTGDVDSKHSFRETLVVPYVVEGQVIIERRMPLVGWRKVAVVNIPKETDPPFAPKGTHLRPLHEGGPSAKCVNICFISEGYSYKEELQFLEDAQRASEMLLAAAPYSEHKDKINTYALAKLSRYTGIPLSEKEDATNTNFDTSYGALGMDRYMVIRDPHALHEAIGNTPCDAIVVLCNSDKYGGCGLFNQHCALPARIEPDVFEYLLLHEFGHAFAGLGDEYFDSGVTYTQEWLQMNPPWEPNVSLLERGEVRWQAKVSPDTPVPTPWRKDEYVELAKAARDAVDHIDPNAANKAHLGDFLRAEAHYGKVGAFEGARYTATGLYRPEVDCRMFSKTAKSFCAVCSETIANTIKRVSGQ